MGEPMPGERMGLSDLWRCARTGGAIHGRALRRLPQDCSERIALSPVNDQGITDPILGNRAGARRGWRTIPITLIDPGLANSQ
jgi:hypothetical protein